MATQEVDEQLTGLALEVIRATLNENPVPNRITMMKFSQLLKNNSPT